MTPADTKISNEWNSKWMSVSIPRQKRRQFLMEAMLIYISQVKFVKGFWYIVSTFLQTGGGEGTPVQPKVSQAPKCPWHLQIKLGSTPVQKPRQMLPVHMDNTVFDGPIIGLNRKHFHMVKRAQNVTPRGGHASKKLHTACVEHLKHPQKLQIFYLWEDRRTFALEISQVIQGHEYIQIKHPYSIWISSLLRILPGCFWEALLVCRETKSAHQKPLGDLLRRKEVMYGLPTPPKASERHLLRNWKCLPEAFLGLGKLPTTSFLLRRSLRGLWWALLVSRQTRTALQKTMGRPLIGSNPQVLNCR